MDRVITIKHHPCTQSLLLSISEDHNNPTLRLWNTVTASLLLSVALPLSEGIFSAAWSPDGSLVAVGTKSKTILIFDPRSPLNMLSISCHDSLRPVHVAWASPTHLISTGFSKSASREIFLYSIDSATLPTVVKHIAQHTLDVSPAPLFPIVDLDTMIVFLYSKGERNCSAFEVDLEATEACFAALPSFGAGSLARKLHLVSLIWKWKDWFCLSSRFLFPSQTTRQREKVRDFISSPFDFCNHWSRLFWHSSSQDWILSRWHLCPHSRCRACKFIRWRMDSGREWNESLAWLTTGRYDITCVHSLHQFPSVLV